MLALMMCSQSPQSGITLASPRLTLHFSQAAGAMDASRRRTLIYSYHSKLLLFQYTPVQLHHEYKPNKT
jgi:hypothetical protein